MGFRNKMGNPIGVSHSSVYDGREEFRADFVSRSGSGADARFFIFARGKRLLFVAGMKCCSEEANGVPAMLESQFMPQKTV